MRPVRSKVVFTKAYRYLNTPLLGRIVTFMFRIYGLELPPSVKVGKDVKFAHRGFGTVIHPTTRIGDRVKIYQGVTVGRRNAHELNPVDRRMGGCHIGDDVVLCAGAVILPGGPEVLSIGAGTVIGANSVLLESTGEWEIWAGVPARLVGQRDRSTV